MLDFIFEQNEAEDKQRKDRANNYKQKLLQLIDIPHPKKKSSENLTYY